MEKDKIFHQILFSLIPRMGPITAGLLLETMGGLDKVLAGSVGDFLKIEGISVKGAEHIVKSLELDTLQKRAYLEMDFLEKNQVKTYFLGDKNYPRRLKQCPDAPILLYSLGDVNLNHERIISMVGSRKATAYGKQVTHQLLQSIQDLNVLVISGLAYGIDIQAHRSCIEFGIPTLGVLGHGLDNIYPPGHWEISQKMKIKGGLLTEFTSGTEIMPGLFPRRNRIIAGLCDALVVVEAAQKGGALITADLANSYNREVFAVPGRITDLYSQGCLELIRDQKAQLILNGEELSGFLNWFPKALSPAIPLTINSQENSGVQNQNRNKILNYLVQNQGISISSLENSFPELGREIRIILLELELDGKIRTLPGNILETL